MKRALCLTGAFLLLATGLALVGPRVWPGAIVCSSFNGGSAQAKCKEYHDAVGEWARVRGEPPASLLDMQAPLRPGDSAFIHIVDDPWGNPYVLEREGADVRIRCVGPDGRGRTADDIVYPEERR